MKNETVWDLIESPKIAKDFRNLPKRILKSYYLLVDDLRVEGPFPRSWDSKPMRGRDEVRIRLNREYRVLLAVVGTDIIVVKVAHRKEVYR